MQLSESTTAISFRVIQGAVSLLSLALLFLLPIVEVSFDSAQESDVIKCYLTQYVKDGNTVHEMCIDRWESVTTLKYFLWGTPTTFESFVGLYAVTIIWACFLTVDTIVRMFIKPTIKYHWIYIWLSLTLWAILIAYHWQTMDVKSKVFQTHETAQVKAETSLGLYSQLVLFLIRCLLINLNQLLLHKVYKKTE